MSRRLLTLALLGGLLALGDGEGRASPSEGRFSYATSGYAILDPAHIVQPNDERLVLALFEPLTAIDPITAEVVPAAAERWAEAPDGRSWTFTLRGGLTWSDGKALTAQDYVEAWRRLVDPEVTSPWHENRTRSPWDVLLRPLRGCARLADDWREYEAVQGAVAGIRELIERRKEGGVPGDALQGVLERTGARGIAEGIDDADVRRLLRWGSDPFPSDKLEAVLDRLVAVRRETKRRAEDGLDAFGKTVGAVARDARTLEVLTDGPTPWLPRLMARGPLVGLHPQMRRPGDQTWDPAQLVASGPFLLEGRGPKPHRGVPNPNSLVHLVRRDDYAGALPAQAAEVFCYTDLGTQVERPRDAADEQRRLASGELAWIDGPSRENRKQWSSQEGLGSLPPVEVLVLRLRCDRPPFDRLDVRKAFARSIDRNALAARGWPKAEAATRLLPPAMAGAGAAPSAPPADVKAAQAALKAAGIAGEFPWTELHYGHAPGEDDFARVLRTTWKKHLGVEVGETIDTEEERRAALATGSYQAMLGPVRGAVADPWAYVGIFSARDPRGGLGWKDEVFERLCAGAEDPKAFLDGGEAAAAGLPEAVASAARTARGGGPSEREALRRTLLVAAEARLLEACVVVPLLLLPRPEVRRPGAEGLGSEAAWRDPGFVGSLRHVKPAKPAKPQ